MAHTGTGPILQGHRVLIIEDELLIALDLQEALSQIGAEVSGIATTVEEALVAVASPSLTAAIVDLRLSGQSVRDAVQALADRLRRHLPRVRGRRFHCFSSRCHRKK